MREIVLDTETTGLNPAQGHRIVEIGCIELENHLPTGKHYQVYLNPERDVPREVVEIHGLTGEFLSKHVVFAEIVDGFLDFIGAAPLVIHNASFDMGFINAELVRAGKDTLPESRAIDTLQISRRKFPGAQQHNLDALCRRFSIDNSARAKHGALLDAELLAEVYLELVGGRQPDFDLTSAAKRTAMRESEVKPPRPHQASVEERAAHEAFVETLANPVWRR